PVTGKLVQTYFPAVNSAQPVDPESGRLVDYFDSAPGITRRDLGTTRIDWQASTRNAIHFTYNGSAQSASNNPVLSPFAGLGLTQNDRRNHTLSVSYIHEFPHSVIDEVRGGFNRQNLFRRSNQTLKEFLSTIGFDAADIGAYGRVVGGTALDTFGHTAINWG